MACCGGRRKHITNTIFINSTEPSILFENGSMSIIYKGESADTFYGVNTGAQYKVSPDNPIIVVDNKDAITGMKHKPGLLELVHNKNPLFEELV